MEQHTVSDLIGFSGCIAAVLVDHVLSYIDRARHHREVEKMIAQQNEEMEVIRKTATNNNKEIATVKAIVETKSNDSSSRINAG